jgi:hypothetical protein
MLKKLLALAAVPALGALFVLAQAPGRHPGYLHALSELRYARDLLERGEWGPAARDQQMAIGEIDRAIRELSRAAADDGKNLRDHPPIDQRWQPRERLPRTEEALGRAREYIEHEEDNPAARQLRNRAFQHIDEARRAVRRAMDRWR